MELLFLFTALCTLLHSDAARILAILPAASHSHGIWNRVLMEALASRGHSIVAMTPDPGTSTSNLRYVNLENTYVSTHENILSDMPNLTSWQSADMFYEWITTTCVQQFQSKGFKEILESKDTYDLIIMEVVGHECYLGLVARFNVPVVAVTAYGLTTWNDDVMAVPQMLSVYPHHVLPYSIPMTLLQRVENVALTWYSWFMRNYIHLPEMDAMSRKVFGADIPPLQEIERNYSIMIVNSGPPGVEPPRAYPPNVIEVGCLHCRPGKKLPQDLKKFLDDAKDGVIYFSLGSNLQSTWMTNETLAEFLSAFSSLPQHVLWKWESDSLPGQPSNVKLGKWMPQQDILAHPNLRVFITHGGKLSTQEATYHGVPVLALPVFIDQHTNAQGAEDRGVGLMLPFKDATKSSLLQKLNILLSNDRFRSTARFQSKIMHDQPETPLDRAVFWTEYVLRHNGAPHLRSAATQLSWYQLYLLDFAAAIFVVLILLVCVIKLIIKSCCASKKSQSPVGKLNSKSKSKHA